MLYKYETVINTNPKNANIEIFITGLMLAKSKHNILIIDNITKKIPVSVNGFIFLYTPEIIIAAEYVSQMNDIIAGANEGALYNIGKLFTSTVIHHKIPIIIEYKNSFRLSLR